MMLTELKMDYLDIQRTYHFNNRMHQMFWSAKQHGSKWHVSFTADYAKSAFWIANSEADLFKKIKQENDKYKRFLDIYWGVKPQSKNPAWRELLAA
jgi:hypothetical protein